MVNLLLASVYMKSHLLRGTSISAHTSPVYPGGQTHVKSSNPNPSQVPPFSQGWELHGCNCEVGDISPELPNTLKYYW